MRARAASVVIASVGLAVLLHPAAAQTAASANDFKSDYKRPEPRQTKNPALVELGRELFFDPQISASGKTACVTCHLPQLGWSVIDVVSLNDSGKLTTRKSQTLLGLGYAEGILIGWDGRNASLEAQAKSSIATGRGWRSP